MDKEKLIHFFEEMMKLKKIERSGWVVSGVKKPESVADHSFMTSLMVLILGKEEKIDVSKALKMAIIHDIAECRIGDIITWKNFHKTKIEKKDMEEKAINYILSFLGDEKEEFLLIWKEYEEDKSPEARFVKAVDRIEMVLQALKYEKEEKNLNELFETFFEEENREFIKNRSRNLLEILEIINHLRKSDGPWK